MRLSIQLIRQKVDTRSTTIFSMAKVDTFPFQKENFEEYVEVEKSKIKPGTKYFIVRADGDSMNKVGINDKDLVLCRYSEKGETGDSVTIKYYDKRDSRRILLPKSTNKNHQPIIPEEGDIVQGIVQEVINQDDD